MTFGKYPDVSPARACDRHAQQRSILAEGMDPMAQKKAEKTATRLATENSFATVAGQWLDHWKDDKSPRHVDSPQRRLASNILPTLGALQMDDIQAPDIVAMVLVGGTISFLEIHLISPTADHGAQTPESRS
jgi:hypothetical protein